MNGRELTREQVMQWRESWSWDDRRIINENLDRLGAKTFIVIPSGSYVICANATGERVMYIGPGWVHFTRGNAPKPPPEVDWLALSTFRAHQGGKQKPDLFDEFCKVHGLPVLASGLCETCEEDL